ncbi:hypothetical protein L3Q82_008013 [Scortum barcoo]|uniref:Uncharacterized protein n=1 Tax=Scortum barcoo TaxID=214431 RepID=A0ACB8WKF7_9TELE|nr:hypothetical protein L3Q82_008013 [Scortum barcoo]
MVLSQKRVDCPLWVGEEFLPQVEELKYLGVLFMSEGKMEQEMDRRIVERSQLRWFRHLVRMPPGRLPAGGVSGMSIREETPGARPRTPWRDYISRLSWEQEDIPV